MGPLGASYRGPFIDPMALGNPTPDSLVTITVMERLMQIHVQCRTCCQIRFRTMCTNLANCIYHFHPPPRLLKSSSNRPHLSDF